MFVNIYSSIVHLHVKFKYKQFYVDQNINDFIWLHSTVIHLHDAET